MNNVYIDGNIGSYPIENSSNAEITYKILVDNKLNVTTSKEIYIPLSIVRHESSLESIVLYLKDRSGLRFNEIAKLLNRDQRTIWVTYSNVKRKGVVLNIGVDSLNIPLSIFVSRKLSMLESIVLYLKSHHDMSFVQISSMLDKNYRTIWTVYRRAMKKMKND